MTSFARFVAEKRDHPCVLTPLGSSTIANYPALYAYSIKYPHLFWFDVLDYCEIIYSSPPVATLRYGDQLIYQPTRLLSEAIDFLNFSPQMDDFPEWFPGMKLNFAQNILRYGDDLRISNQPALFFASEDKDVQAVYTFAELLQRVKIAALSLRDAGVCVGDRVAAYVAAFPEAVVTMLATSALGAIWFSASPDFGITGVVERLIQIKPKVVFSVNAVLYNDKVHDNLCKTSEIVKRLLEDPECANKLRCVVIMPFRPEFSMELSSIPLSVTYDEFLRKNISNPDFEFPQLPFHHPLYIVFSSGTTGRPKGIVHSVGGTLLQHAKEHKIHGNLGPDDKLLQYTTTGWMMWHWAISALVTGAGIVVYDGSPLRPTADRLLKVLADARVTAFGTSARYFQSLADACTVGRCLSPNSFDLSELHSIYSTGSPLAPSSYDFVYSQFSSKPMLSSITGGTDILSLFIGHNTNLPVRRGELQAPCLGMAVEAWNSEGQRVPAGTPGDLVCTRLFPAMPVFFWNDLPSRSLYRAAYFSNFPHIWSHGDFIVFPSEKFMGVVMLGRSDGTLNPAGVRFGSSDLYGIVEGFHEISDSLAVGQKLRDSEDERVCLFLMMSEGHKLTDELKERLRTMIREQLSSRHVPAIIVQVADIPYTINNKKVEVAVKRIISGDVSVATGSLRNPESLAIYSRIPELNNFQKM